MLCTLDPLIKYLLQFSIIEFKIDGTPGKESTFLTINPGAALEGFKILENYYGKSKFNEGRKKMAKMPRGSKLIYNPSSAAPGFITQNVISLPGVPSILNSMIENCKQYLIKGLTVHSKTLNLFTVESNISKRLGLIQKKYKRFVDIGSYPFFRLGKIGVSIVTRSTSKIKLQSVNRDLIKLVRSKKIKILKI